MLIPVCMVQQPAHFLIYGLQQSWFDTVIFSLWAAIFTCNFLQILIFCVFQGLLTGNLSKEAVFPETDNIFENLYAPFCTLIG